MHVETVVDELQRAGKLGSALGTAHVWGNRVGILARRDMELGGTQSEGANVVRAQLWGQHYSETTRVDQAAYQARIIIVHLQCCVARRILPYRVASIGRRLHSGRAGAPAKVELPAIVRVPWGAQEAG